MSGEHSRPGGHVYPTGVQPRRGDKVRHEKCGCSATDTRHIAFCEAQHQEFLTTFERWRNERAVATDPLME